jgi:hypothetical protein
VRHPPNRKRIDLDADFKLDDVRALLMSPHAVNKEFGIPVGLQNRLDAAGLLPVYKIGSRSVLYRADVERVVASLPRRLGDAPDAAAVVAAELESIVRVVRLIRQARRVPHETESVAA